MDFEWDKNKEAANILKHGIDFDAASRVFGDPNHLTYLSPQKTNETREITIGIVGLITILAVVHTDRDGVTRIISARPASCEERKKYEQNSQNNTR